MLGDEKDGMEVELQNLMGPRGRVPRGKVPRGRVPRGRVFHGKVQYTVASLNLSCYYIPLHN